MTERVTRLGIVSTPSTNRLISALNHHHPNMSGDNSDESTPRTLSGAPATGSSWARRGRGLPRAQCSQAARAADCDRVACTEDCRGGVLRGAHVVQDTCYVHVSVEPAVPSKLGGAGGRALCSYGKRLLSRT